MGKSSHKVRFGIASDQIYSEIWSVWSRTSDLYVTCRSMGGQLKLSIHKSGICQLAFTEGFAPKVIATERSPFADRTIRRWKRSPTPRHGPAHVCSIFFSSFERWEPLGRLDPKKPIIPLRQPENGYAVEVAVMLSWENPIHHCGPFGPEQILLAHFRLDSGEFVTLLPRMVLLPPDYFHFRKVPWFLGIGYESEDELDDVRGISSISLTERYDGGIDFHSMHNMRLSTFPADCDLNAVEQPCIAYEPLTGILPLVVER